MKGLLIKDARTIWHSKKIFIIMLMVAVLALYQSEAGNFIIGYMTMIGVLLAVGTISYDEYDKSIVYLMTLPAERSAYVAEKYVLMFGCGLAGTIISTLLCLVIYHDTSILIQAVLIYVLMAILQFIMLPLQLKFGGEKGRVVLYALLGVAVVVFTSLDGILGYFFGSYEAGIGVLDGFINGILSLPPVVNGIIILAVGLLCFTISFLISKRIVENREF